MLNKAREGMHGTPKVDLREGDAEALEFPDNSFDTVISTLSTCSFYDPISPYGNSTSVQAKRENIIDRAWARYLGMDREVSGQSCP